jgi:mRNA interferase RelE/StbE
LNVEYFDTFDKDLKRITDQTIRERIDKAILSVESAKGLHDIPHLEKLKGHRTAYRIRVGVLRLGIYIEDDTVLFKSCMHRSKIYKVFPK